MKKVIWKLTVDTLNDATFNIPKNSQFLSLQLQHGVPCIWVLVDSLNEPEEITIKVFGTGHEVEEGFKHFLGTFQLQGGNLVFHVFQY